MNQQRENIIGISLVVILLLLYSWTERETAPYKLMYFHFQTGQGCPRGWLCFFILSMVLYFPLTFIYDKRTSEKTSVEIYKVPMRQNAVWSRHHSLQAVFQGLSFLTSRSPYPGIEICGNLAWWQRQMSSFLFFTKMVHLFFTIPSSPKPSRKCGSWINNAYM